MTKQIKLLPCPFCGQNEQEVYDFYPQYAKPIQIRCEYCGALGPPADSSQGAKKAWNERGGEDKKMKLAREIAAQAWCKPATKNIEMNPELCKAFAEIIYEIWIKS